MTQAHLFNTVRQTAFQQILNWIRHPQSHQNESSVIKDSVCMYMWEKERERLLSHSYIAVLSVALLFHSSALKTEKPD